MSSVRSVNAVEKLLNNLFFKKKEKEKKTVVEITYFLSEPSVHSHTAGCNLLNRTNRFNHILHETSNSRCYICSYIATYISDCRHIISFSEL